MMPPHDGSSTEPSPSGPSYEMYCSPIGGALNTTTAAVSPPLNGEVNATEAVVPSPKRYSPPAPMMNIQSSPDSGDGMFCAPISGSTNPTALSPPPPRLASLSGPQSAVKMPPNDESSLEKPTTRTRTAKPPPNSPPVMLHPAGMGGAQSSYHPDFMFCGSCTTCQPIEEKKSTTASENLDDYLIREAPSDDSSEDGSSGQHQSKLRVTEFPANSSPSLLSHSLLLQSLLHPLAGVESVVVEKQEILVKHTLQTSQAQLVAALKRGGYTSRVVVSSQDETSPATKGQQASRIVRSQFHVTGICCAMEIPAIRKIVKPLYGVETLQINITTKMVYVQHDSLSVSAQAIADSLTKEGFPSEIRVDGAARFMEQERKMQQEQTGMARTRLKVQMRSLTAQELGLLRQQLDHVPGIEHVDVDVEENCLVVDHDEEIIEADSIPPLVSGWELTVFKTEHKQSAASKDLQRSEYVESTLTVENLQHRNIETIQTVLRHNYTKTQVRAFFANVPSHTIKLEHNPELLSIHDVPVLLDNYGFNSQVTLDGKEANLFLPAMEEYGGLHANDGMIEDELDTTSTLKIHVILSGFFWILSMLSTIGGVIEYFQYFGLFSVFFGLPPVARKAWRTIRRRQFDSNCMMVTAALGALALQEYDEAASVAFLFSVSEFLEARSTSKARKALKAIVQLRPDHASVINPSTKEVSIIPASLVPLGSLISIRTGDKIAADGVVVEGMSTVDESSLTGESRPILKQKGDAVSGGTINVGTTLLVVKTTSSVEDSVVSRLIKVVEDAQSSRSMTEKMIDKFARSYTPFVVCLAGIMCTIPWLWGTEIGRYWTLNGLIIIVIACPCSLTISTPVTYAAGLAATAQRGIIVKGGAHLEALGGVNNVIMDKTGTLTYGQFRVEHLKEVGTSRTRKEMLELLALMEAPSSHPLSETLVRAARREGVTLPKDATVIQHTILKGEGVTAQVNGKQVFVGNQRLFQRIGMYCDLSTSYQDMSRQWAGNGATVGFIGVEGEGILGMFSMIDTIREEAHDTIQALRRSNINVAMLTGDSDGAAQAVAKQVGIPPSYVHSQLLPEDKLHFVGSLIRPESSGCGPWKAKSKVLFIGDGINDTPALAVADVGVSMGDGAAALAMEVSDVTLMDSNLSKLLYVIKMGSRVVNTIQENIAISLLSKMLVVGLTFAGKMSLFGAIASDVGVMLVVTLNGMKLLPVSSELEVIEKRNIQMPRLKTWGYDQITKTDMDSNDNDVQMSKIGDRLKSYSEHEREALAEIV